MTAVEMDDSAMLGSIRQATGFALGRKSHIPCRPTAPRAVAAVVERAAVKVAEEAAVGEPLYPPAE
jgi:hypothetical protein